jgi:uncharacterized membrane protein
MIDTSVFATSFLASAVEIIEMVITVVGVGAMRGWRSTLLGAGAGLVILAALILGLGTALTLVPVRLLRVLVGSLLFVFGLQWLRKGNRPVNVSGLRGMGARAATDDDIPTHGMDWIAFLLSFRGVVLEGLEVTIIVVTFGAAARAFPSGALAAAVALVVIGGAGALARRAHSAQRLATGSRHAVVRVRHILGSGGDRNCMARLGPVHHCPRRLVLPRVRLVHHAAPSASASRTRKSQVNHVAFLAAPRKTREHSLAPGLRDVLVRVHRRGRLDRCRGGGNRIICDLGAAHRGHGIVVDTAGSGSGGDRSQPSSHQRLNAAEPAPKPNQRLIT